MRYLKLSVIGLIAVFITSCSSQPVACFEVNNNNPEVVDTVFFTNCSTEAETYFWTFGDGSSSHEKSPSYKYTNVGIYLVTLVVLGNKEEETSVVTQTITVDEESVKHGQVAFWREGNPPWDVQEVLVMINNVPENYQFAGNLYETLSSEPDCGDFGTLTFTLPVNTLYGVQFINQNNGYQEGATFTLSEGECLKIQID